KEHNKEAFFGEVLIPTETVTEPRAGGKSRVRQKNSFPGYIFVEMDMSEEAWHLVKDTPKVTGFIGNQRPQEVKPPQIDDLRKIIVEGAVKPKPRVSFETGDEIRVIDGAFANAPSMTRISSPVSNDTRGFGFTAPSTMIFRRSSICGGFTSCGRWLPMKPVTLGVSFTRCQISSVISISTKM